MQHYTTHVHSYWLQMVQKKRDELTSTPLRRIFFLPHIHINTVNKNHIYTVILVYTDGNVSLGMGLDEIVSGCEKNN